MLNSNNHFSWFSFWLVATGEPRSVAEGFRQEVGIHLHASWGSSQVSACVHASFWKCHLFRSPCLWIVTCGDEMRVYVFGLLYELSVIFQRCAESLKWSIIALLITKTRGYMHWIEQEFPNGNEHNSPSLLSFIKTSIWCKCCKCARNIKKAMPCFTWGVNTRHKG